MDKSDPQYIKAWENGDDEFFAAERRYQETGESEEMWNSAIVEQRSQAWIPQLQRLLSGSSIYFVVVGCQHMVGPYSVPMLLKAKGYNVERIDASTGESDPVLQF